MRIRRGGNSFTELLPSDSSGIVDVFTERYQRMFLLTIVA
jgi:hypothetical protein